VTEVPPVKAHITEYQFPNVVCGECGKTTRAPLPEEIAGHFGPQGTALIAYWTVVCRLPRRLVEAMLADVLGIEISLGSTQKAWEEVSQAVAQPVQQLQEQLPREAVWNVDETGWRTNGDKRWIWGLVAQQFVFYVVACTRGAEVLVSLLGALFRGILCRGAQPGDGAVYSLRPAVHVFGTRGSGAGQPCGRADLAYGGAVAQDQFRQP
jgi:transposase